MRGQFFGGGRGSDRNPSVTEYVFFLRCFWNEIFLGRGPEILVGWV